MVLIILLIGTIFTVMGWIFGKFPPKNINPIYGYRSPRSKKSQAAWDAAQVYSARIMRNTGIGILALSIPVWLTSGMELQYVPEVWIIVLPLLFSVVPSVIIILQTENFLKKNFDSSGNPLKNN
ncbi:SdpI family protein [Chitinophaga caseinilytica]|uniref:SdpI family protein n=1 Tax=Chitinophaga caseinilytica TaxID=2267521 RepID=A0ABZ2Z5I7_9BACT